MVKPLWGSVAVAAALQERGPRRPRRPRCVIIIDLSLPSVFVFVLCVLLQAFGRCSRRLISSFCVSSFSQAAAVLGPGGGGRP